MLQLDYLGDGQCSTFKMRKWLTKITAPEDKPNFKK